MTKSSPKDSEKEGDDWHQFSNAGYSSASADFDNEEIAEQQNTEEEWFDGDDFEFEGNNRLEFATLSNSIRNSSYDKNWDMQSLSPTRFW